jgi:hypothetical protein
MNAGSGYAGIWKNTAAGIADAAVHGYESNSSRHSSCAVQLCMAMREAATDTPVALCIYKHMTVAISQCLPAHSTHAVPAPLLQLLLLLVVVLLLLLRL